MSAEATGPQTSAPETPAQGEAPNATKQAELALQDAKKATVKPAEPKPGAPAEAAFKPFHIQFRGERYRIDTPEEAQQMVAELEEQGAKVPEALEKAARMEQVLRAAKENPLALVRWFKQNGIDIRKGVVEDWAPELQEEALPEEEKAIRRRERALQAKEQELREKEEAAERKASEARNEAAYRELVNETASAVDGNAYFKGASRAEKIEAARWVVGETTRLAQLGVERLPAAALLVKRFVAGEEARVGRVLAQRKADAEYLERYLGAEGQAALQKRRLEQHTQKTGQTPSPAPEDSARPPTTKPTGKLTWEEIQRRKKERESQAWIGGPSNGSREPWIK